MVEVTAGTEYLASTWTALVRLPLFVCEPGCNGGLMALLRQGAFVGTEWKLKVQ